MYRLCRFICRTPPAVAGLPARQAAFAAYYTGVPTAEVKGLIDDDDSDDDPREAG
jgi:hypothetical protein